jgi:hypothetical protein
MNNSTHSSGGLQGPAQDSQNDASIGDLSEEDDDVPLLIRQQRRLIEGPGLENQQLRARFDEMIASSNSGSSDAMK